MTQYHLASRIVDASRIYCELSTTCDDTLLKPILCFSVQAPGLIKAGGTKLDGLGGFTVIQLEGSLTKNTPLSFELGFEDPYFWVSNRAWHPQGPYLRHPDGSFPTVDMDIPLGVKVSPAPAPRLPDNGLALLPLPTSWIGSNGTLSATAFEIEGEFEHVSKALDDVCHRRNLSPLTGAGPKLTMTQDKALPHCGYELHIDKCISLKASDAQGAFYGLMTALNLRELHNGQLPCGALKDTPRFEWRGFMLDCVREFYPPDAIKKLLDLMALLKFNRFHWHFADDEAFRLEVDTAPSLWKKSAFRGEGEVLPGLFGGQPGPRGGSYSKLEAQDIIAHAKALHIEVLPEIEVPAHALALTEIMPELRDPDDVGREESVQGYKRNVVNPAQPETWDLLEPLALEVAEIFPFKHIHLGGDELPETTWEGSPAADKYKQKHGLVNYQDMEGHILNRLAAHVAKAGITPCAWQEAADGNQGGIQNDAILFSWTGSGPGLKAAEKGYRVVMCPAQHTYFDMAHTMDPDDWGANWAANYALDETINWDPIPEGAEEFAHNIIGVEGTFWSEFTSDATQFEPMIAPRILGLATMGWSPKNAIDLKHLRDCATCYMPFFERIGWQAHGGAIMIDTPPEARRKSD